MDIQITKWSEREFAQGRLPWNRLLAAAEADPLFLSWEWQYSWWEAFGTKIAASLQILAATAHGELVGIAPLYLRRSRLRRWIPVRRLQFIGNCWRDVSTTRSEHLEFIVRRDVAQPVTAALLEHVAAHGGFSEFVLADVKVASETCRRAVMRTDLGYIRSGPVERSFYIDTRATFSEYLGSLGKGHQRRLYKQRPRLESLGAITIRSASHQEMLEYLETLDKLHAKRWGSVLFDAARLAFNKGLIERMREAGGIELSMLSVDDKPVSMLYLLHVPGRQYYIQGGFDDRFARGVAVNSLHLGYAIERAFLRKDVERFYLLAGSGKRSDYKHHLAREAEHIVDLQCVRAPLLKLAYTLHDRRRTRAFRATAGEGISAATSAVAK